MGIFSLLLTICLTPTSFHNQLGTVFTVYCNKIDVIIHNNASLLSHINLVKSPVKFLIANCDSGSTKGLITSGAITVSTCVILITIRGGQGGVLVMQYSICVHLRGVIDFDILLVTSHYSNISSLVETQYVYHL